MTRAPKKFVDPRISPKKDLKISSILRATLATLFFYDFLSLSAPVDRAFLLAVGIPS